MWKQFAIQGIIQNSDTLPKLVKKHNNTKHSSIKITPIEASKKNNKGTDLYGDMEQVTSKPKFKIGDKVRINKYKRDVFEKGYTSNWTEKLFTIDYNIVELRVQHNFSYIASTLCLVMLHNRIAHTSLHLVMLHIRKEQCKSCLQKIASPR